MLAMARGLKQNFYGINAQITDNLKSRMKMYQQDLNSINSAEEMDALKNQTIIEIKDALAAFGYFEPTIQTKSERLGPNWVLNYHIKPGRLLKINKLDVKISGEGRYDHTFIDLMKKLPLHVGDPLRSKIYQNAKSSLVDLAAQRGYFAAEMTQSKIIINQQTYQSTIILHFDTGPRYYFGSVCFHPSPYSNCFLQRFVPFRPGQPYLNSQIVKLQENLSNSGFFRQISVTPKPELASNLAIPIEVEVIPRKRLQYSLGVGYGTDTGVRGTGTLQLRQLNCYGHHLEAQIQASEKLNHLEASYSIPGYNPATDSYRLSVAAENQHLDTSGKSQDAKIEASHIKVLWGWQQTVSLALRDEHSFPTDGRPIISSTMLLPNINWSRVKSDDPLSPSRGYQLNINIRGASKSLISNTDFIQALIQGKIIVPLSKNNRVIGKGQFGYTLISNINELPISLQFYTGGAETVRGYKYQEIGPGKTLVFGSFEFQQRLRGNLYAAAFVDAGNVSNTLIHHLDTSVGVGLVWRSPVGAIEMTLAQTLDKPGHPRMLQFSMGPEL